MLAAEGAAVDAILVCPHAPEDDCACRKPRPGMALEAAERFGFDPAEVERAREDADHVVPDLAAAVDIIAELVTGEPAIHRPREGTT